MIRGAVQDHQVALAYIAGPSWSGYVISTVWPRGEDAIRLTYSPLSRLMTTFFAMDDVAFPPPQPGARRVAEVLLIVLVFFTVAGDPPPHVNEAHYLTRLKQYWNPEWCAGDLFLESADTQLLLIWLFGWVTKWLSLPATAWVGRVLTWTLLAWAWQRLSWRLVPVPLVAMLSAALFVTLNAVGHLAGEWIVGGVEAKCFAYVFVLLALRELADGRWNRLWLLLGAAAAFHPLVGGWSVVVCAAIWLVDARRHVNLFSMGPGLAGGLLLGLVGVLPALSLTWNESDAVVAEANRIYVFDRLPHHLALLSLPSDEVVRRFARHALLLVVLAALGYWLRRLAEPVAPLRRVILFAWGAVLLAVGGVAIELVLSHDRLVASGLLRYYWYRLTDFAAPMAVSLTATALLATGMTQQKKWATWALLGALVLAGWHITSVARSRWANPVPPADEKMDDFTMWVKACDWAAENTPPKAVFLTPRLNHSFKWRTGRAEVVTRKDIPQDVRSIVEWHRRLKDVFYYEDSEDLANPVGSLSHLGTERVRELAIKYGANYVLTERDQLLSLPRVYPTREHPNDEYVIYRIDEHERADGE